MNTGAAVLFSLPFILLAGAGPCLLMHFLPLFSVTVPAGLWLLMAAGTAVLVRREGLRARSFTGLLLISVYLAGNMLRFALLSGGAAYTGLLMYYVLALDYLNCLLAGTVLIGLEAVRHKAAYDKDYVIILGCSIRKDGGLLPLLKARTDRGIRFAWDQERATGRPVHFVPSGGQGPDEIMSEGSAMELYLLSHAAESYEILTEKRSRNTLENLVFSRSLIDREHPGAVSAFVTSDYHVLRSSILARRAGIAMEGISSRTKWYFSLNAAGREFFAIHSMYLRIHLAVLAGIAVWCVINAML